MFPRNEVPQSNCSQRNKAKVESIQFRPVLKVGQRDGRNDQKHNTTTDDYKYDMIINKL